MPCIDWKQYIRHHKAQLLVLFVALQVVAATFIVPVAAESPSEDQNSTCDLIKLLDWIGLEDTLQIVSISSSRNTTINESSQDNDGLSIDKEQQLGTDPNSADTDCDGITDYEETNGGQPVDTDQDGTIDALDSDSDSDGRSDTVERANGTNPLERDSSPDAITDPNNTSGPDSPKAPTNGSDTDKDNNRTSSSGEHEPGRQDNTGKHGDSTSTTNENPTNTPTTTSAVDRSKTTRTSIETTETSAHFSTGTISPTPTETSNRTTKHTSSQDVFELNTLPDINSPFIALIGLLCILCGLIAISYRRN